MAQSLLLKACLEVRAVR